jgi:hypothetical protein
MYERLAPHAPLTQGEIIDGCPILGWERTAGANSWQPGESVEQVIVLTQACDLANAKASRCKWRSSMPPTSWQLPASRRPSRVPPGDALPGALGAAVFGDVLADRPAGTLSN